MARLISGLWESKAYAIVANLKQQFAIILTSRNPGPPGLRVACDIDQPFANNTNNGLDQGRRSAGQRAQLGRARDTRGGFEVFSFGCYLICEIAKHTVARSEIIDGAASLCEGATRGRGGFLDQCA